MIQLIYGQPKEPPFTTNLCTTHYPMVLINNLFLLGILSFPKYAVLALTLKLPWFQEHDKSTPHIQWHGELTSPLQTLTVLSSISISFEMKPKLKDAIMKLWPKAMLMGIFPFTIHNLKCDVLKEKFFSQTIQGYQTKLNNNYLIRWTRMKPQNGEVFFTHTRFLYGKKDFSFAKIFLCLKFPEPSYPVKLLRVWSTLLLSQLHSVENLHYHWFPIMCCCLDMSVIFYFHTKLTR